MALFQILNLLASKLEITLMFLNVCSLSCNFTAFISLYVKKESPWNKELNLVGYIFLVFWENPGFDFCLFIWDALIRMLLRVGLRSETPTLSLKEQSQNHRLTIKKCKRLVLTTLRKTGHQTSDNSMHGRLLTWEADLKHYSLLPVFDRTDGGELVVKKAKEGARQQAHQAHEHTVVAGVCILVEDTVETLAADVNIALVHNGGKDHQGEYLWPGGGGEETESERKKMEEMNKRFSVWSTYFWLCLSASLVQTLETGLCPRCSGTSPWACSNHWH